MEAGADTVEEAKRNADEATREAAPWVERLARFGYAAKGIVYGVVGVLAAQAAFGTGGETTGTSGALVEIVTQPFGQVMLAIVAVGLLGYVVWRFVQAVLDPENKGTDAKGLAQRAGYLGSGIAYAGLALVAVQLLIGSAGGNGNAPEDWTARLLQQPYGRWLVGLAGLVLIGIGLAQLYRAYEAEFRESFKTHEMSEAEETWATRAGRLGLAARGVVYGLTGLFFIQAARQFDPQEAGGMGQALQTLARQPYGPWVLGSVALGLLAYGIYSLVNARYRRIFIR